MRGHALFLGIVLLVVTTLSLPGLSSDRWVYRAQTAENDVMNDRQRFYHEYRYRISGKGVESVLHAELKRHGENEWIKFAPLPLRNHLYWAAVKIDGWVESSANCNHFEHIALDYSCTRFGRMQPWTIAIEAESGQILIYKEDKKNVRIDRFDSIQGKWLSKSMPFQGFDIRSCTYTDWGITGPITFVSALEIKFHKEANRLSSSIFKTFLLIWPNTSESDDAGTEFE